MLRVGVVGLEHYHVTGWVETLEGFPDDLEIVALYDPDPALGETLAPPLRDPALRASLGDRYRSIPFETRLDDLIERHAIDVALVTLPNIDAPAAIETLARAGIHMIVDKPAALTAAESRRTLEVVAASGVRTVVGLTRRYAPAPQAAAVFVADGRLGPVISAEAVFITSSVAVRDPENLLFDPARTGGGILSWLGIHDMDTLLWVVGEPVVEVSAMAGHRGHPGLGVEDVISVAMRFAGGGIGTIHDTYALPGRGYRNWFGIRGQTSSIELRGDGELLVLTAGDDGFAHEDLRRFEVTDVPGYGASGRAAVADLIGAIGDGRETLAPFRLLPASLAVIDAAYESARTGRRVAVDPDWASSAHRPSGS